MDNEINNNEIHEVDTTKIKQGRIVGGWKAWSLPTPTALTSVANWIRNICVSGITLVAGTDLFTPHQAKVICFVLGAVVLLTGGAKASVGVDSSKKN